MKGTIGPYRISERIGTGGMGEVFKAFDDRLNRWVAIKRIRPGKEDTDENRERFLREARATAALNHSAIVHVYDIFRDGESDCIVMEYVEGRSLQNLTANGALEPLQAIELGQEVAEGLAAAHAKQILHRDLKTENIIVTPEGHAKILDFGLAKPLITEEFDSSLTGKGQLVGTSRAMSPEYVGGDRVDHRSDLFALGVLLYEAVTGHSPFKAQNTLATLKQVIVHQQPPARDVNPEVPEEVSDLIDRLLEKSPEDRPQSAKEVAQELDRIGAQYSSGSVDRSLGPASDTLSTSEEEWSISTTIMGNPRLRRIWASIAGFILALLVGAYFLGRQDRLIPSSPEKKVTIVLGHFQNKTTDPLLDDSLAVAFKTGLEQSRTIDILSQAEVHAALERMERDVTTPIDRELGIAICQREGVQALIIGSIIKVGPVYSMSAQVIDSEDEIIRSTGGTAATQADILGVLQRMIDELRTEVGESMAEIKASPSLDKVTTPDLEALKLYYYGVREHNNRNIVDAISYFESAIERDPEFAMAHAKLGVAYQYRAQLDKVLHHFTIAKQHSDRLTRSERLYIDGWLANLQGSTDEMVSYWRQMKTLYSDEYTGYHNLGMVYFNYLNLFPEAAENLKGGLRYIEPQRKPLLAYQLAYSELALGHYEDAKSAFEEHEIITGMADVLVVEGRYDKALQQLEPEDRFSLLFFKSQYDIDRGRFTSIAPWIQEAVMLADQQRSTTRRLCSRMTQVTALLGAGNDELNQAIESTFSEAKQILLNESVRNFAPIPFLATLGKISARTGETDRSKAIHDLIQSVAKTSGIGLWESYLNILEGEILLAEGDGSEAMRRFHRAITPQAPFQAHDSLAHALEVQGHFKEAIQENLWMEGRRGRAFAECCFLCCVRSQNILDWNLALLRLGRLYEASGDVEQAKAYYRRFYERWSGGDDVPPLKEAGERLRALEHGT